MNYKIYIQSLNNFPIADWAVSAYQGFRDKQANIIFFEDIEEVPVSKANIVVAFIEDTNKYLEKLGLPPKQALNIPWQLKREAYLKRRIESCTMRIVIENNTSEHWPLFIKPDGKAKEFVAGVVKNQRDATLYFNNIPLDTKILCSEVVDFVSEYRCYIINGVLKGMKHYLGDPFLVPNKDKVLQMIADYTEAPAGYSLDVGILSTGETVLVECNDGWSLGNYGLDHSIYSTLLATRWREMIKGN